MIIPLLILAVACIGFFVCMRRFDPFFAMSEAHSKKIIAKASKPEECLRVIPVVERLRLHGGTKDVGHDNCPGCLECIPIARVKKWREKQKKRIPK